jgi:P27 family predicted phage terminase small subunit
VLTTSDTAALSAYCEAWITWKAATQQIRKYGMVLKGTDGELPKISPFVQIADKALSHLRALLVEFGMTPSSRARVHVSGSSKQEPQSKWAGLK